jgi:hypothetical protein
MIARVWTGAVRTDDAELHAHHIRATSIAAYRQTAGNHGTWLLQRHEAIRAFAGDDIDVAVLYPEDERHLIGGATSMMHYDAIDRPTR